MNIDVDELTLGQMKEIQSAIGSKLKSQKSTPLPFKIGDAILIRTVTMIQLGRVKAIGRDFFVLEDGGWVADTARFNETLSTGDLNEFERAPSWFVVGRGAVIDIYPWTHDIPKVSK